MHEPNRQRTRRAAQGYLLFGALIKWIEVEPHRGRKHDGVLRDYAQLAAKVLQMNFGDVDAVDDDLAAGQFFDAKQGHHKRRFAASVNACKECRSKSDEMI